MKKQLIIIGIIITLLTVGLSGCNEQDNVKIVDYNIFTHWHTFSGINKIEHVENGFYHNYPDEVKDVYRNVYYSINGTIKNTCDKRLDLIKIDVICYDNDGVELFKTSEGIYSSCYDRASVTNLPSGYSEDFELKIYRFSYYDQCSTYFDDVESFDFDISISE